ncbi:MAG: serine/threonine protein kinase [Myxococcales bacterium]|nr:serine/threonine protein kinase [Myxococcales bacterium]
MTEANDEAPARASGLAATHAVDPVRLALAATHGSKGSGEDLRAGVLEDRSAPSFGLALTRAPAAGDAEATARTESDDDGPRERMARPLLDDLEERRRRQALKARLFGDAADAVKIGRFQVLGRLGAGGMGVVYAAYDEQLDRKVAVKVLRQDGGDRGQQRLRREAQAMARLSHPNIVGVHEVGEEGDSVYVAMEFVRGESLDRWLERPRPWREVLAVFMAAGRGLQAAHAAGLVHRDFKPANAILGEDGTVKVLDFGLARAEVEAIAGEEGEATSPMTARLTRTGAMMGTPAYMSPEQFAGEPLSAASDQFSFFVALYEGLYRTQAFAGDSVGALAVSVTKGRPNDPPGASEVPGWLRAVILRGLAREPGARWPDMAAALAALASDPARRRRRIAAVLGLALVSGGASAAVVRVAGGDGGRCEGVAAASERVWHAERAATAHAAFAASGPIGEQTWALLEPKLAAWIEAWARRRGERCAAYAAGELSDTLHDRSVACLERQLARVDALVTAFVVADARTVEQAPPAIAGLPELGLCDDAEYLLAEVPPPEDPQARAAVADGREALEAARAAIDLGAHDAALARATTVAAVGRSLRYEPLVAQAEVVRGEALLWQQDVAGAEAALGTGLELGLAGGDERTAVEALARRIYVQAELAGRPAQALDDAPIDRALLRRVPSDGRLAWLVENNIAVAEERQGRVEAAAEGYAAALRIAGELGDGAAFELLVSQYNLGLLRGQARQFVRATELLRAARTTAERIYGPDHPALIAFIEGEAGSAHEAGRSLEARELCRRARAIAARSPDETRGLVVPVAVLEARIAVQRREADAAARVDAARSLAAAAFGPDSPQAAYATLRPLLDRPERDAELERAVATLAATGAARRIEAVVLQAETYRNGGRPELAVRRLAELRADEGWGSWAVSERFTIAHVDVEAKLASGQVAAAEATLAEAEGLLASAARADMEPLLAGLRGRIAAAKGEHASAVTSLRRALEFYVATFDADHPRRLAVQAALAESLRASGQQGEATALGREALAGYRGLGAGFEREAAALAAWVPAT